LLGFVVMLLLSLRVLLMNHAQLQSLSTRWINGERSVGLWFDGPLFLYSLSYVVAALMLVRRYRRLLLEHRSDADRMSLRWLDVMAICQMLIWGVGIVQSVTYLPIVNYGLLFGLVAAWVCVVGWFSLGQPPVIGEPAAPEAGTVEIAPAGDDARFEAVEVRLSQLMSGNEALYLEPALTIGQVAKRSGYPEYLVSSVINRRFGCTFWDYVNRLRIDAARSRLADDGDARTILDIAYACGFTSKSTFNAAFKRQIGETPSSYRKSASSSPA
ncbi:MAG: AraC family transcriptional regulator, partial [Pseudoxanthomonas sp.]